MIDSFMGSNTESAEKLTIFKGTNSIFVDCTSEFLKVLGFLSQFNT